MRVASALAAVSLVFLLVADVHAAAPSLSAARKSLEGARADLAAAVKRIEKDPPSTADLDAAHAAVGALKDALDAGAQHEPKDLEYAKSALAARKELRQHGDYVEARRAKVHIHKHRRVIDGALADLVEKARAIEGKAASEADFEAARASAAALRKSVEDARQFTKDDQGFAAYIAEVDGKLGRHQKAIDARWTAVSVGKHKAKVEEGHKALTSSLGGLSDRSSDQQFKDAEQAASVVAKLLEEGKVLEDNDKGYRAYAAKVRSELAQSKKKMDELWSATGLARLKAEIEPAHKDLASAGKALKARRPTEEQLALARTASIVVRKLVEKFEPEAKRSKAFGDYVAEVKKTLVEVEVQLQRRTLMAATADLTQALKRIERRAPEDAHFDEANTALVVLEKTLETVHQRNPELSAYVGDAKLLIRNGKATIAKRRVEVDVQRQRAKVEAGRRDAANALKAIYGAGVGEDQLKAAEGSLQQLKAVLESGAELGKKDREYAAYDREVKKRIDEMNERIAQRRIALAAAEGRTALSEAVTAAKALVEAARQPGAADADIDAASKSVDAVSKVMEARASLEEQDRGYAAAAERGRNDYMKLAEGLELAREARALRKRTVEALLAGSSAADSAEAARDARTRKKHYEAAVAHFRSCETEGANMVEGNRALANVAVLVEGRTSTPKEVMTLCTQRAEATEPLLAQVTGLVSFEEGPKRAFEAGKVLLGRSRKSEALKQFNECISSGRILEYRNPELKERKFEVAGAQMTLAEVIAQCVNQSQALRGK